MKKPILSLKDLKELGFKYHGRFPLENNDFYRWWSYRKNDSEIHITYEFSEKFEFISAIVDFNCEKLKGREITKKDVELLIELM